MSRKKRPETSWSVLYEKRHSFLVGALSSIFMIFGLHAFLGMFSFFLSPLPLLIWVRLRKEDDFFLAAATGAFLTFILGSAHQALFFLMFSFVPALCVHVAQAIPNKALPHQKRSVSSMLGVKVCQLWVIVCCCLAVGIFYMQIPMEHFSHVFAKTISPEQKRGVVALWPYVPFTLAALWFGVLWFHFFVLVPFVGRFLGHFFLRPSLEKWSIPPLFYALVISAFCLSSLGAGDVHLLWLNICFVLCLVFVVDGLLTLYTLLKYWKMSAVFYVILALSIIFVLPLAVIAFAGMMEPVVGVRKLLKGEKRG